MVENPLIHPVASLKTGMMLRKAHGPRRTFFLVKDGDDLYLDEGDHRIELATSLREYDGEMHLVGWKIAFTHAEEKIPSIRARLREHHGDITGRGFVLRQPNPTDVASDPLGGEPPQVAEEETVQAIAASLRRGSYGRSRRTARGDGEVLLNAMVDGARYLNSGYILRLLPSYAKLYGLAPSGLAARVQQETPESVRVAGAVTGYGVPFTRVSDLAVGTRYTSAIAAYAFGLSAGCGWDCRRIGAAMTLALVHQRADGSEEIRPISDVTTYIGTEPVILGLTKVATNDFEATVIFCDGDRVGVQIWADAVEDGMILHRLTLPPMNEGYFAAGGPVRSAPDGTLLVHGRPVTSFAIDGWISNMVAEIPLDRFPADTLDARIRALAFGRPTDSKALEAQATKALSVPRIIGWDKAVCQPKTYDLTPPGADGVPSPGIAVGARVGRSQEGHRFTVSDPEAARTLLNGGGSFSLGALHGEHSPPPAVSETGVAPEPRTFENTGPLNRQDRDGFVPAYTTRTADGLELVVLKQRPRTDGFTFSQNWTFENRRDPSATGDTPAVPVFTATRTGPTDPQALGQGDAASPVHPTHAWIATAADLIGKRFPTLAIKDLRTGWAMLILQAAQRAEGVSNLTVPATLTVDEAVKLYTTPEIL